MVDRIWLQHYPEGVPHDVNPEQYGSLTDMLEESLQKYKDKQFSICMDVAMSYGELDQHSAALGAWLQAQGLEPGARVAIMLPNVPQYPVAVAAVLRAGLGRPHDLAARYGGEEFVCLLPDCGPQDASAKAQELCQAVRSLGLAHSASPVAPVVTLSAGVACLVPDERNSPEALLARADANLYRAKSAGRDRVDQGVETLQLQ